MNTYDFHLDTIKLTKSFLLNYLHFMVRQIHKMLAKLTFYSLNIEKGNSYKSLAWNSLVDSPLKSWPMEYAYKKLSFILFLINHRNVYK